jgi:hypothetical protein
MGAIYHHVRSQLFLERRHLKKDSTQSLQWSYFQGFALPDPLAEYTVGTRKTLAKPLKIRPHPLNAIDVVLERTSCDSILGIPLSSIESTLTAHGALF